MRQLKKAYLEVTDVCNLRCPFCPGTERPRGFLSPEGFRTLAGKLRPHTEYLYLHLMGEPLLHPELGELLAIAGELGFRVMLTTNGTLLRERAELLLGSPALQKVSISLHSFRGEGPESYLSDCLEFAGRAAAAGKRCGLRLWNLGAEGKGSDREAAELDRAVLAKLAEVFPGPWREGQRGTTLAPGIYLEWGDRFDWPDLSAPAAGESGFCMGLRDQVGVLWDGTVVPCCLDHEGDIPLGNLYRQSLAEILESERAVAIYEGFSRRQAVEPLCKRCGYRRRFDGKNR